MNKAHCSETVSWRGCDITEEALLIEVLQHVLDKTGHDDDDDDDDADDLCQTSSIAGQAGWAG